MKLKEIAAGIQAHLKRFEADPSINVKYGAEGRMRLSTYFSVNAWPAGSKIGVRYVSFQCNFMLTKAEAIDYLEWLDAGNVGRHHEAFRELAKRNA